MKKFFLVLLILISFTSSVYSYDLNIKDSLKAINITNKIESFITKKWEIYREIYMKQLNTLKNKYKNNEKIQAILDIVNDNIKNSSKIQIQNKILSELDNIWIPDLNFLYSTWAIENYPFLLKKLLEEKKDSFHKLIKIPESKIHFSLINRFNQDDKLFYLYWLLNHYNDVNWSDELRNMIEMFQDELTSFSNEVSFSKELYNIYKTIQKNDKLDSEKLRIVNMAIEKFELNWINLPEDKISQIKKINQELTKLSFQFSKNVLDSEKEFTYYIDKIDTIKEIPADVLAQAQEEAKKENKEGYLFNANNADYLISYSSDEEIRKKVRIIFKSFASSWEYDNREIILKILNLRQDMSKLLWYKNYWEYSLANKMAPSPEFVLNQEDQILTKAKEKGEKEIDEIIKYFNLTSLNVWDH
jgi:Zn-dependent oligopeptidase